MTKQYGIQILLDGGQTLLFNMPQQEAQQLVTDFQQNSFRLREKPQIGGTDTVTGVVWAVKLANIIGLHTVVIQASPTQLPTTPSAMASGARWGVPPDSVRIGPYTPHS